jgi:hypothetical protein
MDAKEILSMILDEEGVKRLILEKVLDEVVKGKLDELVQKSDNTLDDALLSMIYPLVRDEVAKQVDKLMEKAQPEA